MMSLFSSFDIYFFLKAENFIPLILILMLTSFTKNNLKKKLMKELKTFFNLFFQSIKPSGLNKMMSSMLISTMILIFYLNFSSIFSYNFALTSQMSIILFFSLGTWFFSILMSMKNNLKGFLSHAIPEGTPIPMVWFLFLIEMISNMIRPITLSIRLVANILAGHLLLILLSKLVMISNLTLILYLILNSVEMFVSLIQSYIFVTMMMLYYSELN